MNLIDLYENERHQRVRSGELAGSSGASYWHPAAEVLEALVGVLSEDELMVYVREWGAKGKYRHVIRRLKELAEERKGTSRRQGERDLVELYERGLEQRVEAGEIIERTKHTTMYGPPKVLEALVGLVPVSELEAHIRECGARGDYGITLRRLKTLAKERKERLYG